MTGVLPVTGLYHLGVVVPDCQRSMANYSRFFGIPRWDVQILTNNNFRNARVHGRDVPQHFISALAIGGPVGFELCQPLAGDRSVYSDHLDATGGGLHHSFASMITKAEFAALQPALEQEGLKAAQQAEISDTVDYYYYDTQDQLGTLVELVVTKGPDPKGGPPTALNFGPEIIDAPDRLPIDKLYHYAVASDQPVEIWKRNYERIYGVKDWYEFDGRAGETVRDARYRGLRTDYQFRTRAGRNGALGIEVVQPEVGASIFTEKLARGGPGMHHIMTTIMRRTAFDRSLKWLNREGIAVGQDHWTPDGSTYVCFLDARERLDGLYIEVIVLNDDAPEMSGATAEILTGT